MTNRLRPGSACWIAVGAALLAAVAQAQSRESTEIDRFLITYTAELQPQVEATFCTA